MQEGIMSKNIESVQAIYAAFGKGDVPAILERLSDDIEWEYGATPNEVPWLQPRRGRAEVPGFFASLAGLELTHFAPTRLMEADGVVVVLVDLEGTVKATGKPIREKDEAHIWHFDGKGRVVKFCHRADTLQQQLACRK
jgi:ketosteroid isomerase-like protein